MPLSPVDKAYLAATVELAEAGLFSTTPNPRVGCLLVKDGAVVGRGAHLRAGSSHAEVLALAAAGEAARGCTAYVSLEPCCVQGRTGPCTEALIEAGVRRVVSALVDPHPRMKGRGLKRLQQAGVMVKNARLPTALRLNQGYVKRHREGLPWVRLKLAMSLDGRSAMADGTSQWISGEAARRDVQYWRARSCALLTGAGTVREDDPRLTLRDERYRVEGILRQPLRVVVASEGRVPMDAKVFEDPASSLLAVGRLSAESEAEWQARGIEVLSTNSEHADLTRVLGALAERGCNEVLVEAGPKLAGSMVASGLWDEMILYVAPRLLGRDARGLLDLAVPSLDQALQAHIVDVQMVGQDVRMILKPA